MSAVRELDPFQHETLRFLDHAHGKAILADPMGARKTGSTLAWLATQPVGLKTLVVAPSAVHGHWDHQAMEFYPDTFVVRSTGQKKARINALEMLANDPPGHTAMYITTYEGMKADQHHIIKANFHAVVFDEGHRLKGRTNQVGLTANAVTKKRPFIICVTGTPVLNHPHELWQYLHMLAPTRYPAFWRWAEEHFVIEIAHYKGNRFPTRIIHDYRPGHDAIVRAQVEPFLIQRELADLFPGQPWIEEPDHVALDVDFSVPERKAYDNLVKHKWAVLPSGKEITTQNSLDRYTRFQQMASDWGTLDDQAVLGTKSKAAVEKALDLLAADEPVLIFAKYKPTVHRLLMEFVKHGVPCAGYHGDLTPEQRDNHVKGFAGGMYKVLVGTLDSMSEGVDGLQTRCNNVIMVDRHWTTAKNDQAIGRIRRSGQHRLVTVWHIYAKGTIDFTIVDACLRKTNVVQVLKNKPLVDAVYGR